MMPVVCDLRLDRTHLASDVPDEATIERWLVPERVTLAADTRLATISFGVFLYALHNRFRCQIWTLGLEDGLTARRGDLIVQLAAERARRSLAPGSSTV